jgi:hypothetical protein
VEESVQSTDQKSEIRPWGRAIRKALPATRGSKSRVATGTSGTPTSPNFFRGFKASKYELKAFHSNVG